MSEINITPLLDLGFVLLVIFIITTAPIANDSGLDLPRASKSIREPPPKAVSISVDFFGRVSLNSEKISLDRLLPELIQLRMLDPDLSIVVRGDSKAKYGQISRVMTALQRANIVKVELATQDRGATER